MPLTHSARISRRLTYLAALLSVVLPCAPCSSDELQPGKNTVMVPMADDTRLATDVWLPEGEGPWPVAMARTPYDKNALNGSD